MLLPFGEMHFDCFWRSSRLVERASQGRLKTGAKMKISLAAIFRLPMENEASICGIMLIALIIPFNVNNSRIVSSRYISAEIVS